MLFVNYETHILIVTNLQSFYVAIQLFNEAHKNNTYL